MRIDDDFDAAHEADMRDLMRQQLRDNISPEEAAEECEEYDEQADHCPFYVDLGEDDF